MKPYREYLTLGPDESFRFLERVDARFPFEWHCHPDFELVWIGKGHGMRFVGDHIEPYRAGEVIFLGPELPHTWASQGREGKRAQHALVLQFRTEAIGDDFLARPENEALRRVMRRASHGLAASGAAAEAIRERLERLRDARGPRRLLLLIEMLCVLAEARGLRSLASSTWRSPLVDSASAQRIDRVHGYLAEHLHDEIRQSDVAAHVGMAPASFARFFKRHTGRTLTDYLAGLRIGWVCDRLRDSDDGISDIAFAAGFGNLSNFNRVFRRVRGMSPREYRASFR